MIGVKLSDGEASAVDYDGDGGIRAVLADFESRGWTPLREGDVVIGLKKGGSSISLEPGGQFEHASAPIETGDDFCAELRGYRAELGEVSRCRDITWVSVGFRPFGVQADVPWMPKGRYKVMRAYLPTKGALATEMMQRTATVQANLDFADEADAARKLRAAYSVTSILTAVYANSPIVDEQVSTWQSYRSRIWQEVDPDRCGFLPFIFDDSAEQTLFANYTEWALDVPMFFVYQDGTYHAEHMTFRQFMAQGWRGHRATAEDWELHLSTLFPEVRLKSYIELRGCDVGSHGMIAGLGPLASGFLYNDDATKAATELTSGLTFADRIELSNRVAQDGLAAAVPGTSPGVNLTVGDLAREFISICKAGLKSRQPSDLHFLDPIAEIIESGRTQADRVVELWAQASSTADRVKALTYPGLAGRS